MSSALDKAEDACYKLPATLDKHIIIYGVLPGARNGLVVAALVVFIFWCLCYCKSAAIFLGVRESRFNWLLDLDNDGVGYNPETNQVNKE